MPPTPTRPLAPLPLRSPPRPRLQLLCVPHAGGSALAFRGLAGSAPEGWAVSAVDLPGHLGADGPLLRSVEALAEHFDAALSPHFEAAAAPGAPPLVLLGHSLGGLVVHALVARIESSGRRIAAAVITATRPPHATVRELSRMEDDELLDSLLAWGWISSRWRDDRGALAAFLPALRADLVAADDYRGAGALPLQAPLVVIGARDDAYCSPELLRGWSRQARRVSFAEVTGGHLFHEAAPAALAARIDEALRGLGVLTEDGMADYTPDLINELTKIVVTTRNKNPSDAEYDAIVLPEWERCEAVEKASKERPGGVPTVEELRAVLRSVLLMLRVKHVPEAEIRARLDEAFERCRPGAGLYPVDRAAVEAGAWAEIERELDVRLAAARARHLPASADTR